MTTTHIQNGFVSGELSPKLLGRTDFAKYHLGCLTMRNFFVNYQGGASSRAGLKYCGTSKQSGNSYAPRLIRFQYNITQGFTLEFGNYYMRILSNGAYVTETPKTLTGVDSSGLFTTSANHGFAVGDWVYDAGNVGFSGLLWIIVTVPALNTFTVQDMFGNVISSATASAGGTVARVYTVVSPYAAVDIPYLKFTQSANLMSLTCVNQQTLTEYPAYDLQRVANTNWTFTQTSYASSIAAPASVSGTVQSSTTINTWYSYVVIALDASGNESVASRAVNLENNNISIYAGSNTVSWSAVAGATSYNIYEAPPSYTNQVPIGANYGFIGTSFGTQFTDSNITPDYTRSPPIHQNPFARGQITNVTITAGGTGYTQAGVGYTITTSTGSGFVGIPIVVSGAVVGFYVQNNGQNYANSDTITFTGGSVSGVVASGFYRFTGNPVNGNTIVLNGITWTFVTGASVGNQTTIQGSAQATINQLSADLAGSANASINVANYYSGALILNIIYGTPGVAGNAYTLGVGSYAGTISGATLTGGVNAAAGGGATATLTFGAQTGTYPSVVSYFQQRRVYADTITQPDTYFFSKTGEYNNMDYSIPTVDNDAVTGTPWAQQINGIQWLIPMPNGLVVLTGNGGWLLSGTGNGALTPSSQFAVQQANVGCSKLVQPILINADILYVQSKNSVVRDLTYNFFTNIYTGEDKTILASHLVFGHTIVQWAYSEEPFKIVWCVREDGILLSLTWLKEQDIWGWARHDTDGLVVSVAVVTEPPVDAVYVVVKRYIQGQWLYYTERMDNRIWNTVEDCFCVDAGLSYPQTYPQATLIPAAAKGTNNISAVDVISGGSGYTAPTVVAIDSFGNGSNAVFTVTLSAGVITAITPVSQGYNYTVGYTTLSISDATGSGAIAQPIITNNVAFTASSSVFSSGNVGDVIRVGGGIATVTQYVSGTQIIANITQNITETITNNPNSQPVPATSGNWSITTPVSVVGGLNHLNGQTVAILADGSVVPNQVVTNNAITLPQAASSITIGLPYICQLQTMYLDPQEQTTTQTKRKMINAVGVRVEATRGISVGANQPDASFQPDGANVPWINMAEVKERNNIIPAGQPIKLFTGDYYQNITSAWKESAQIAIEQTYPLPANILALIAYLTVGDTNG